MLPGVDLNYRPAGRHLMSLREEDAQVMSEYGTSVHKDRLSSGMLLQFNRELSLLAEKLNITDKLGNMCPMYFNSTESNRYFQDISSPTVGTWCILTQHGLIGIFSIINLMYLAQHQLYLNVFYFTIEICHPMYFI